MKLQSNNLLANLTTKELKILTTQVKETLGGNFKTERKRIFSAAEFWDIQRAEKMFSAESFTSNFY